MLAIAPRPSQRIWFPQLGVSFFGIGLVETNQLLLSDDDCSMNAWKSEGKHCFALGNSPGNQWDSEHLRLVVDDEPLIV